MPKLYCPPPLRVSAESVQSMHQDRCRCIQVHTLRLCPPLPVHACAFGLTLFCCIYYIIAYKKSQAPVRTDAWLKREMIMNFTLRADVLKPPSAGLVISEDSQALSHLHLYCLTGDNKSQEQSFCFRETLRKTLTTFRVATFRIFWGHRCILNLSCVLRTCSVSRSPSHQPSTWHNCLRCRWLGESSPTLKLSIFWWSIITPLINL